MREGKELKAEERRAIEAAKLKEISDIQAESGVIGTLLNHPEFILHSDYLKKEYFFEPENGALYEAISTLYKEGISKVDAYNISSKLQQLYDGGLDKYNLPNVQELVDLYREVSRSTLEEYTMLTDIVVETSFKRDLVVNCRELEKECFKHKTNLDGLSKEFYESIDKLTSKYITGGDIKTLGEEIDDIWKEIESRRTSDGIYGIPSKYKVFNNYFTYESGELVVIQAKYKEGKSVITMNEAVHKLQLGIPTLVIDTEMTTRQYVERLVSLCTGIEVKRIKSGKYSDDEANTITECLEWIKTLPFVHIYSPEVKMEEVYTICKKLKYRMNLQFLVFDYLKSNEKDASENYNLLGAKCDFLKNKIAGELDMAVLSACQLNRSGEVADSIKINRYLSVGIKWGHKTQDMMAKDGADCGNCFAKIYLNRIGSFMPEDDENAYLDFFFDGDKMCIEEAKQHIVNAEF